MGCRRDFLTCVPIDLENVDTSSRQEISDGNFEYMLGKEKKKRKIVTLMYHFPADNTVNSRFIKGTDLCVYDGILDKPEVRRITPPSTPSRLLPSTHSRRSTFTNR